MVINMKHFIDLNQIQFYKSHKQWVGAITKIEVNSSNVIKIIGYIDPNNCEIDESSDLLLVDKYHRYLNHIPLTNNNVKDSGFLDWEIIVSLSKIANIPPIAPVRIYLLYRVQGIALLLSSDNSVYCEIEDKLSKSQASTLPDVPTYRPQLLDLIVDATSHKYVSRSIHDSILTGNNYQTIDLGDTLRMGGRKKRYDKILQIDFMDKKVLDIGANTGEISRYIRRLGARLVDGYEYDQFFVETGRMINAYTGTTRVSLFQGDATRSELYTEPYDVVVALSVYVYIKDVLKRISEISDVMVFETHTLDHGLDFYLSKICKFYPFYRHLGFTDEDPKLKKSRALLIFSKKAKYLDSLVKTENVLIPEGDVNYYYNNVKIEFNDSCILSKKNRIVIENDGFDSFLANLAEKNNDISIKDLSDLDYRFFSNMYWVFYLLGYHDYLKNENKVDTNNRFYIYYSAGIEKSIIDPNLLHFTNDIDSMLSKLELKFKDISSAKLNNFYALPPIYLNNKDGEDKKFHFETNNGRIVSAHSIDGHHRLFLAKLFGAKQFPFYESYPISNKLNRKLLKSKYTLCD